MFFTGTESFSFAVEIHNQSVPVLIYFFIVIVYLKAIIYYINDDAEWLVVRFIRLVNDLEESHCQGAAV